MTDNNKKTHLIVTGRGGVDQVQADWNQTDTEQPDYIKNKPELATVATSGSYNDLTDKPTIPTQVQADWNETDTTDPSYIQNKPTILTQWFGTQAEYDLIDPKDPNTVYHIEGGAPVQSNWNESDNTSLAYIQNKPTIPAAQVNSDWNASSGVAQILNKPSLATVATSGNYSDLNSTPALATVATSGDYDDLTNKPTIPAAQVNSDWNSNSGVSQILNKPSLATVATSGNYSDLNGTPTLATVATSGDYDDLQNKPTIPAAPVQSDWNEADSSSLAYITNKPTIPAAQVNSDWNAVSGVAQILNKPTIPVVPPMDTETLTFTMQDSSTREITFFTVRTGYFYVEDVSGSDNTLTIRKQSESVSPTIEVFKSTDQVNWTSMGSTSTTGITATVPANGKLYLKAIANIWTTNFEVTGNYISCSGNFNIGGNLKSIINGDNFNDSITSNTQCCHIFHDATTLISAANLIMPSEAPNNCFFGMFRGCSALTTAPVLPATTVNSGAYAEMFKNCSALTTAPVISATAFNGGWSCAEMFSNCTSLTTAPALPATTLGQYCYENMFRGCTNLNNVTIYANDISATSCVNNWLDGVAATGDFYNLGTATYTADSASGIPTGWTEHTTL